jgi:hypothetical protein
MLPQDANSLNCSDIARVGDSSLKEPASAQGGVPAAPGGTPPGDGSYEGTVSEAPMLESGVTCAEFRGL